MSNRNQRLILDSKLWIEFLLTDQMSRMDHMVLSGDVELVLSNDLLGEVRDVLEREPIRKKLKSKDIEYLSVFLTTYGVFVEPKGEANPADDRDKMTMLATDGQCDFLLTEDPSLLARNKIAQTRIMTYQDWVKITDEKS